MNAEKYHLRKWLFALLLLAGTAIRFIYGYSTQAWLAAPDQLAWGLGLDEMMSSHSLNYMQLAHAPHEGGSVFIGLFSLVFQPLTVIMPPLSWAALVMDTFSRAVQLTTAQKLFGNRTALLFGIWTVLSIPLLIPWGTVNYGLHSLFSFIPFVFLYVVMQYRQNKYLPVICGILSGIAMSVSYDNIVLVMASVGLLVTISQTFTNVLHKLVVFAVFFLLAILPHVLARVYFDPLFGPGTRNFFSIRDVPVAEVFSQAHLVNLVIVWFTSLPGSFLLSSPAFLPSFLLCGMVWLFIFAGLLWYVQNRSIDGYLRLLPISLVVLFVLAYALSPFFENRFQERSYVYYRHWCYIIPLMVLLMIQGFVHSGKVYIATGWIVLCGIASIAYMWPAQKIDPPSYRAAGWILAKKYMDDPGKLYSMQSITAPAYRNELLVGYGWGLSAAIFNDNRDEKAVEKLVNIIRQSPAEFQPALVNGVYYSFNKGISPVLDPRLMEKLRVRFSK